MARVVCSARGIGCNAKSAPTLACALPGWRPVAHQRKEHFHANLEGGVGEVVAVAVQARVAAGGLAVGRLDADEEEAARDFLEVVGKILAAHARLGDRDE